MLPDENCVIHKSFPKYLTTPNQDLAQDILFYGCHEYVGIIWDKVSPFSGALREVDKIYHDTLF